MCEALCSAVCKFSVYILILSIMFDTEGRVIALWNFVFSHVISQVSRVNFVKGFHVCI